MKRFLAFAVSTLLLASVVNDANAGEILKCEKRNSPARSRVSVQVEDLAPGAMYTALIKSGNNAASASKAADIAGKVEIDFDSNPNNVIAGATAISPRFIGSSVSLIVTDAMGAQELRTSMGCKVR